MRVEMLANEVGGI